MENTITKQDKEIELDKFVDSTGRWCQEDVLKLARHFHEWDKEKGQYLRVKYFILDDVERFKGIGEIKELKVCLALEKATNKKITFCPYFKVNDKDDLIFKLTPISKKLYTTTTTSPSFVPDSFKEMICKNWDEVEMHLIDDLFHCEYNDESQVSVVRVLHYQIGDVHDPETDAQMLKQINDLLSDITDVTLYPGVDMNKFQYKKMISFTPTIGVGLKNTKKTAENGVNLKGVFESWIGRNQRYFEYLRPCPPTCPPPPPPPPSIP